MKTKTSTLFFIGLVFSCAFTFCCSNKSDDHCPGTNEKVNLSRKDVFMPYQGNEQIRFLHNNADTQTFSGQGKETYYITEGISMQGECPKDYESVRVKLLNQTTNDILTFAYERDKLLFGGGARTNQYTDFKFLYKGKTYTNEFFIASDSVMIGTKKYAYVAFYGIDTDNYVARNPLGILRIRVNSENWDLIL